jgi:hypothetical protein
MVKQLIYLLFLIAPFQFLNAQFALDQYHPTALIKSEKIFKCEVSIADENGKPGTIRQVFMYDAGANVTENIRYFQNFTFKFDYDKEGRKTAEYLIPFGEDFFQRDTFIYDRRGRLKLQISHSKNGYEKRRNEYKYCGKKVKTEKYFYDDELQFTSRYSYDKKKRTSKVSKSLGKTFLGAWEYEYDEHGNMSGFRVIAKTGETDVLQQMKSDAEGRRIEMAVYNQDNQLIQLYRTHYDDKGLITYQEEFTSIRNNDPEQSNYVKTIYQYFK